MDNDFVKLLRQVAEKPQTPEQIEEIRREDINWRRGDRYERTVEGEIVFIPGPGIVSQPKRIAIVAEPPRRLVFSKTPKQTTMFDGRFQFGYLWKIDYEIDAEHSRY